MGVYMTLYGRAGTPRWRKVALGIGFVGFAGLASAAGMTTSIPKGDLTIELETLCEGLVAPVMATHAGDRSKRLFIVDQPGTIHILNLRTERCNAVPFVDLRDRVVTVNPFFDERGLLGVAFHPNFRNNGRLFVRYSAPREGTEDEPCFATSRGCHTSVLSEFKTEFRKADTVDPATERVIFSVDVPQFNHNGGHLAFGPDGNLYFGLGDGGGAHDGLNEDPPLHGPIGNAQNIDNVLGAMLRINVDRRQGGNEYGIPRDNPFAGDIPGADEIYAYGMRNPYRFSFDLGPGPKNKRNARDAKLIVADVGQALYEEINVVRKGGNYGWVIAEGFHCFDPLNPDTPPDSCTGTGAGGEPLLNPIAEFNHNDGVAVIGGHVYRGRMSRSLRGKYVFGDFTRGFSAPEGRLFWLDMDGVPTDIFEFRITADDIPLGKNLLGFGEDEDGELYVLTSSRIGPTGDTGTVARIRVLEVVE